MSTLTKVLIILQVVVVLVLCGLVVTYVATSDNYKKMYDDERAKAVQANQKRAQAEEELEKVKATKDQEIAAFTQKVAGLTDKITAMTQDAAAMARDMDALRAEKEKQTLAAQVATHNAMQQTELFKKAQETIDTLRADQIKKDGELRQASDDLTEKTALLTTQTAQISTLTDQAKELQGKIAQYERLTGRPSPLPANTKGTSAEQTPNLTGSITQVDLGNKLAEISIGSNDGVKPNMEFYITRGNQFICNIQILDAKPEKAVGTIDKAQQEPKVGDMAATNLYE